MFSICLGVLLIVAGVKLFIDGVKAVFGKKDD